MRILSGQNAARMVERLASRAPVSPSGAPRPAIVNDVRRNGDRALRRYAERWDGLARNQPLQVSEAQMAAACEVAPSSNGQIASASSSKYPPLLRMAKTAQPGRGPAGGISLGQLAIPLDSVGCYVPGGRYPLVSTLLMT